MPVEDSDASSIKRIKKDQGGSRSGPINSKVSSSGDSWFSTLVGNVGVGTDLPAYKLDVIGDVNASNFYENGSLLKGSKWLGETNLHYLAGNVGIGTPTPGSKSEVNGSFAVKNTFESKFTVPDWPGGFTVSFVVDPATEFVYVILRRDSEGPDDTSTGDMKIFAIAIDYQN